MFETLDPGDTAVRDTADALALEAAQLPPGVESVALLDSIDIARLTDGGRLEYLRAWEQLSHWVTAKPLPALLDHVGWVDALHHADARADLEQASAISEVSLTLGMSEQAVHSRIQVARDLHGRLPLTQEALAAGRISFWHARAISEVTTDVTNTDALSRIEARVLARATGRPVGQFRRAVRAAVDLADPQAAQSRHRTAVTDRQVRRWPLSDGMACLQIEAAALDVETVWAALTVLAGPRDGDDPRAIGARRVDALLGLCLGAVAPDPASLGDDGHGTGHDHGPRAVIARPRIPVQAHVVVDLQTLLDLADNPCELRGYGPIPAGMARDWLDQADTWRRLVVDPVDGYLLDYGPVVRTAPPRLRDYTSHLHQHCSFPHCTRPATACDLDHEPAWQPDGSGGRTSTQDLRPLCRRHHRFKTHLDWDLTHAGHTGSTWRSPSGTTWDVDPPPVLAHV